MTFPRLLALALLLAVPLVVASPVGHSESRVYVLPSPTDLRGDASDCDVHDLPVPIRRHSAVLPGTTCFAIAPGETHARASLEDYSTLQPHVAWETLDADGQLVDAGGNFCGTALDLPLGEGAATLVLRPVIGTSGCPHTGVVGLASAYFT